MILVVVGLILVTLCRLDQQDNTKVSESIWMIIQLLVAGLQEVLAKHIMDSKYISPYKLVCYEGIIGVVFGGIMLPFLYLFFDNNTDNFILKYKTPEFFEQFDSSKWTLMICMILSDFLLSTLVMLTNF